jgi:partner of Y14 and mago protein
MATSSDGGGGDQRRLLSIPKEGERIIAPTRRPDGTLRKAIRIRAGYVPQEEVAIYQSKGALVSPAIPSFLPRVSQYRVSARFRWSYRGGCLSRARCR